MVIQNVIFLSLVISLAFLSFIPIIIQQIALLGPDAYAWASQVTYLVETGTVNYNMLGPNYPFGFVLYCGGNLLLTPDFIMIHTYLKLACLPYMMIYLGLLLTIIKRVISKKWIIYGILILSVSNLYFSYRIIMFLSSSLATFLTLLALMIIITKAPDFLLGYLLAIVFLINPVYSVFLFVGLFLYIIGKWILKTLDPKTLRRYVIVSIMMIIPFVMVYFFSVFAFYRYDFALVISQFVSILFTPSSTPPVELNLTIITNVLSLNIFNFIGFVLDWVFFIILPLGGAYLKLKEIKKDRSQIDTFLIIFVSLALFIGYVSPFIIPGMMVQDFHFRIMESFFPFLIIASGFSMEWLINKLKNLKKSGWSIKLRGNRRFKFSHLGIIVIFILLTPTYLYAITNFVYSYKYDDSIVECVIYIKENISPNTHIGLIESNYGRRIYGPLYNYDLYYYNPNINWTFSEFYNMTRDHFLAYFIINLGEFNGNFLSNFTRYTNFTRVAGGTSYNQYELYDVIS